MSIQVFKTIIVTATLAPLARQLAAGIAGDAGEGMWPCALSADGNEPATHYCSSGFIAESMAALLLDPQGIVDASGGAVTIELATALVESSDVSDEDAQVAFQRLGIQQIIASNSIM